MKVSHNWLKDFVGETLPEPDVLADVLTQHAFEIEAVEALDGDTMIDVDVLPNRSSDCLSHRGIAREIASILRQPLAHDPLATKPELTKTDAISVRIENPTDCPRFTAALMTDIVVKDSPAWLQERLRAIGQRPINNIVDATNYVMFALGQPLHAYDAELFPQVDGVWSFAVRRSTEGEVVSLIAEGGKDEDRDVVLTGAELLIVDESSNTPIGLAGVKGGRFAGVHEGTTKVIIEAAHFDPTLTRTTARKLGIVIDASKRFENEPSRELPLYAQADIVTLIQEIAGGTFDGYMDSYLEATTNPAVLIEPERVNALLGVSLTVDEMEAILKAMGADVHMKREGIEAVGPFERTDLNIPEDFIEEIGRLHGYSHVESVVPAPVPLAEVNVRHYYSEKIREALVSLGYNEVITSSFEKKDELKLANALASDKQYMRSNLASHLKRVLQENISHVDLVGAQDIRVFEIGTVFSYDAAEKVISEHTSLALGVQSKPSGYTGKDDPKLQEAIAAVSEILGGAATFTQHEGVAEVNVTNEFAQLPVPHAYDQAEPSVTVQYKPFSQFPSMSRDIALWVSEGTLTKDVENVINAAAGDVRVRTTLFDEFTKDGRTSYAFRLVFQSHEKTLTDDEVNGYMEAVNTAAQQRDWEVR